MSPVSKSILSLTLCLAATTFALADGGKVQLRRDVGRYQVTIFTAPTPLRAGPVDLSVMVQDAAGEIIHDVPVSFELTGESGLAIQQPATQAAATNKLLQSAKFVLPASGVWQVHAALPGQDSAGVDFEITALDANSDWTTAGWMLLLPVAFVALFLLRERLNRDKSSLNGSKRKTRRHQVR